MTVVAIVGCMDDESDVPIRGGGKTGTGVRLCKAEFDLGKTIMSNVHLTFGEYHTAQELLDMFMSKEIPKNTVIFFDELSFYLNNLGIDPDVIIAFVNGLVAQSRKLHTDLIHTEQRFNDIPRRLRPHCDRILIPIKVHYDLTACDFDFNCKKPHLIQVYSNKPYREYPILTFYPEKVGQFYDTDEVIYDTLESPKSRKKKPARKEPGG